jgi:hypothetical protein
MADDEVLREIPAAPTAMADDATGTIRSLVSVGLPPSWLPQLTAKLSAAFDPFVRASIAFVIIGAALWLEWILPESKVPLELLSIAGLVTGYYLTGDASHVMKGILSLLYVAVFAAFLLRHASASESAVANSAAPAFIIGQVNTVIGIWYGQRQQARKLTELTAALATATNGGKAPEPGPH